MQNQINNIKTSYLPLTGGTVTGDLHVHQEVTNETGKMVASFQSGASTVTELINQVRYTNGCMGSVDFAKSEYKTTASWYTFIWIPHRTGGLHLGNNGDNQNYGSLLLFPMVFDGTAWFFRYQHGEISGKALT